MGDAASADDRLPWLDTPRPAHQPPAVRSARTPLLVLLGLFFVSAIAMVAFLAGRSAAPVATPAPAASEAIAAPEARSEKNVTMPVPAAPISLPAPSVTTPADPVEAQLAVAPAVPPAERPTASVRQSAAQSADVAARRDPQMPGADAVARRPDAWSERPFAGPPGSVIQVGTYASQAEADAAWWRLARSYPYLGTLPRVVTPIAPAPGGARSYQIRLSVGSRQGARSLCENLHRNRRGCVIDWSQK